MAALTREMILAAADAVGSRQLPMGEAVIDLEPPWTWLSFYDALSEAVGQQVRVDTEREVLAALAGEHEVLVQDGWVGEKIAMELFEALVEPELIQPTFVCDYPQSAQPLARPHRSEPGVIGGTERGTAFTELIDPVIQRERLVAQSLRAAGGDAEAMALDEDFLEALEYAAPPMGGLGLGIDRVLMLLTGVGIRETILFPFIRPES
jgi:lysyl-tRNA synthetase class 2